MTKEQIALAAELLGATKIKPPNSGGYVHFNCPLAPWEHQNTTDGDPSMGFHIADHGTSSCFCFACGFSGELTTLVQTLKFRGAEYDYKALMTLAMAEMDGGGLAPLQSEDASHTGLLQYPEDWLNSFPPVAASGKALYYLATREGGPVPPEIAKSLDMRWDGFRSRVCFPIRGDDGRLYGLHGRDTTGQSELRYLAYPHPKHGGTNPEVWLGENTVDWAKPVVAAESVFDLARVKQVYRNVISPLKAGIMDEALERIKPVFELVTLFDMDKAGNKARTRLTTWTKYSKSQRILKHVYLDAGADGGSLTAQGMAEALKPYVQLDKIIA